MGGCSLRLLGLLFFESLPLCINDTEQQDDQSENSSGQQDFRVRPNGLGEQGREFYNQRHQLGRQCRHQKDSFWRSCLSQLTGPAVTFSKTNIG